MRLEGTNMLPASVETVWKTINDPEALRRCTPGLKELKEIGPDTYQATLTVGIAAVKGTYAGTLAITDKRAPTHYKISLDGSGGAGFMKGEGTVDLEAQGDGTALKWVGDLQIGGLIAGVGQRMLGGVGKMLIGQFFKCLEQHLGGGA
ncbi:MAG TPA: carbon monoxide dehydrogenase subunit G [bacterium]|jgi:uncharacterized protein|nr:carbon monoxide dehydrogenase subunit G [bacterium]